VFGLCRSILIKNDIEICEMIYKVLALKKGKNTCKIEVGIKIHEMY
jgi:hypothetical protein